MHHFENPCYVGDKDEENEQSKNVYQELDDLADILEELVTEEIEQSLDLSSLNRKRYIKFEDGGNSQVSGGSMKKIGSLCFEECEENLDMDTEPTEDQSEKLTTNFWKYFISLEQGHEDFNYEFVDSLCKAADINVKDMKGQSVMHGVAREWNTDVADYLRMKGIKIDNADDWGRTPLFVAVSCSNIPMIIWLLQNGANMSHRTINGEEQLPLHFAARYDCVDAFTTLMNFGANPLERDGQGRTPLFVAAELGNVNICSFFLELELPTASYAYNSESAIDHIISNLPSNLAWVALDQYHQVTALDREKVKVYLSCLGKRRWRLLNPDKALLREIAPTPLDIIVEKRDLELLEHPIILQMIKAKRKHFGNQYLLINNFFHFLFTLIWTASCALRLDDYDHGDISSFTERTFALVLTILGQILTFMFMYKLYLEWRAETEARKIEKRRRKRGFQHAEPYCHPQWEKESLMLNQHRDAVKNANTTRFTFFKDGWVVIEVFCLFLSCGLTVLSIVWYISQELYFSLHHHVRMFYTAFFVLVVWIRLNRCLKYHQTIGPFVGMLEECLSASAQIGFLFMEFFIPFAGAFWVLFGGEHHEGGDSYATVNDLLYQLWLLSFIGDYDYDTLNDIEIRMAQILVGLYLVVVSIITINIYIGLLTEAFARVTANASQRCYMEEAMFQIMIERSFPEVKKDFELFLNESCSPLIVDRKDLWETAEHSNTRSVVSNVAKIIGEMKKTLQTVIDNETASKKTIVTLESVLNAFHTKYDKEVSKEMIERVVRLLYHQSRSIPSVVRKTDDKIEEWIAKIKEKIELL